MKRSILNKAKMSENKKKNPANKEYCGEHPRSKKEKRKCKNVAARMKMNFSTSKLLSYSSLSLCLSLSLSSLFSLIALFFHRLFSIFINQFCI
jgi:hypothetical protein